MRRYCWARPLRSKSVGAPAFAFLNSNWRIPHRNTKKGREIEIEYVRTSEEEREARGSLALFLFPFFSAAIWKATAHFGVLQQHSYGGGVKVAVWVGGYKEKTLKRKQNKEQQRRKE